MAAHNPVGNPSAPYVMPRPAVTLHGSMPTPPLDCNVPPYSCPNISKNTENIPPQPNGGLLASFEEYAPGPVPDPPVNVDHPSMGPMEGGEVDDCPIVPAAPKKRGRPMGSKNKQGPPAKKQGAPPAAKQEPDKKKPKIRLPNLCEEQLRWLVGRRLSMESKFRDSINPSSLLWLDISKALRQKYDEKCLRPGSSLQSRFETELRDFRTWARTWQKREASGTSRDDLEMIPKVRCHELFIDAGYNLKPLSGATMKYVVNGSDVSPDKTTPRKYHTT